MSNVVGRVSVFRLTSVNNMPLRYNPSQEKRNSLSGRLIPTVVKCIHTSGGGGGGPTRQTEEITARKPRVAQDSFAF